MPGTLGDTSNGYTVGNRECYITEKQINVPDVWNTSAESGMQLFGLADSVWPFQSQHFCT